MHTQEENRYVSSRVYNKWYNNPAENEFSYPVYRYIRLEDIEKTPQVSSPQEIRPAATKAEWETYGMMFDAFAKLNRNADINIIPHRTERAMLMAAHTKPEEVVVEGKRYRGRIIPLARGDLMGEQQLEEYRCSSVEELCLLITQDNPYYLIKTYHYYSHFSKEKPEDTPDNCGNAVTREKQEITYQFAALSDIQQTFYPFFY